MLDSNVRVEIENGPRKKLILNGASRIKSIKGRIALHRAKCENDDSYSPSERYEDRKTFLRKRGHNDNSKAGIAEVIDANTD